MNTIMSIVQAEKDGQIESKMIKARQMEEIREARQAEAEKKDQERQAKLEDVKQSLRKKRKRKGELDDDDNVKSMSSIGTKSKKKVAFAWSGLSVYTAALFGVFGVDYTERNENDKV